jgi:cytochrome P450
VQRLRQEIIATVGSWPPTYEDLKNMKYLQQTMHETLRLYPVVPFNMRLALCDTTLPHGGGLDCIGPVGALKDTFVGYSALTLQRRQDLLPAASAEFANVNSFSPERWAHWTPKPWTYIPFNGSPRICIGQQFALTEMGYTIVRVLQHFGRVEDRMPKNKGRWGGGPCMKAVIVLQPGEGVRVGF